MMLICNADETGLDRPIKAGTRITVIGKDGIEIRKGWEGEGPRLFCGSIQYAGVVEPLSGAAGLNHLPEAVLYNGLEISFLDAFAHYSGQPAWSLQPALYMEAGSMVRVEGGRVEVLEPAAPGARVVLITPGPPFAISQFKAGQAFPIPVASASRPSGGEVPR